MIKPTIGRIVWYYEDAVQEQPMPGIVCYVHNDAEVNLTIFLPNGLNKPRSSVFLYQGDGDRPLSNFAEWMPYQKGQAAKTEELEKQIKT